MKIRTDFVTNSSSASFITYNASDERLSRFLLDLLGESDYADLDAPMGAGGCSTGFWLRPSNLEIQDYDPDYSREGSYMSSLSSAIVYYLESHGCEEITKSENLARLDFLIEEVHDNNAFSENSFISSSD